MLAAKAQPLPVRPVFSRRNTPRALTFTLVLLLAAASGGCQIYRNIGKGQQLEPSRPAPHHEVNRAGQEILVAVTTAADGSVADIRFEKSSGRAAIDNYVAESIRSGWPPIASTRSIARVRHLEGGGFSDPEIVSSTPVQ